MKLRKLRIKNFRGYTDTTLDIADLNVIIGKNDVGKSSILDALDIFFNNKAELADLNVGAEAGNRKIEISCAFEINPDEELVLDSTATTTLRAEYLLNRNNLLEISKIIEFGPKYKEISYLIARHPSNFEKALITLKITDLRNLATSLEVDLSGVRANTKKEIRQAIFSHDTLTFADEYKIETDTRDTDIQNIYTKFKDAFPSYMLFRADRTNTDKDGEVVDSLKAITKTAVSELEPQFEEIKHLVNDKIREIADGTLEKLRAFDPDIANVLNPDIAAKALDSLFSFTFTCDNDIPFNKRGSGVKRLMLLSFFLAEAERNTNSGKDIIYAIEEPETSQHPDFQIMLMNSLKQLAESNNRQIILTTHTPEIVKMIDKENLIFIQKDSDNIMKQQGNDVEISKVRDTLGILPYVSYKGVIFVEGPTDITFMKNLCEFFEDFRNIIDLRSFTFIPLYGGGNVDTWIKEDYLRDSNVKCLYFKDRNDDVPVALPQGDNIVRTTKREIENYIPINLVEAEFSVNFTEPNRTNWNDIDVAETLYNMGVNSFGDKKHCENVIKQILGKRDIWRQITFSMEDKTEITSWFNKMKTFFEYAAE